MDVKSVLAGVFLAFGVSNLLSVLNIPFSVKLGFNVAGIDIGSLVLALISLFLAYYLVRSR
ncbi:MAG: hypothetical protein PHS02_01740 [Candidatus ainarchaeum sp.]|nr:hypothetical protein [Candidatus ainarchaeum sp.]